MRCLILSFFQLVLEVFSKLILDIIDKSLGVLEVFLEEGFKVGPNDRNDALIVAPVLGLFDANSATKE